MSFIRRHIRAIAIGAGCAAAGAGASAIAVAGAATGTTASIAHRSAPAHARAGARSAVLKRAVHGDVVVATKTGFATVTFDRGFVRSVSGQQLTLREGTKTRTYKTVTLSIPAGARVRDDGKAATLGQLKAGQRVLVWRGPRRTLVVARTPRGG